MGTVLRETANCYIKRHAGGERGLLYTITAREVDLDELNKVFRIILHELVENKKTTGEPAFEGFIPIKTEKRHTITVTIE